MQKNNKSILAITFSSKIIKKISSNSICGSFVNHEKSYDKEL
jgi:hypothetical protein